MGALQLTYQSYQDFLENEQEKAPNLRVVPNHEPTSNPDKNYYAFGQLLPGRHSGGSGYRYGFNSMEKDDEMYNVQGSSYDFGARMYNSRLGRWMSVDPQFKKQPGWSTYKGFLDNPIIFIDPDGETEYITIITENKKTGNIKIEQKQANRIMTDGVKHQKDGMGDTYSFENYYYDYRTVTYRTIEEDGSINESSTSMIIYDGLDPVKDRDYVWGSGDRAGETKVENWSDFVPEIDDFGGLMIYGSAGSSEWSPATPTKGEIWGSFDFAEFEKTIGLINTSLKTRNDYSLNKKFSGTKMTTLAHKARKATQYIDAHSKQYCETCGRTFDKDGNEIENDTSTTEKDTITYREHK